MHEGLGRDVCLTYPCIQNITGSNGCPESALAIDNTSFGTVMFRLSHLNSSSPGTGSVTPPETRTGPSPCTQRGPYSVASNGEGNECWVRLCVQRFCQ